MLIRLYQKDMLQRGYIILIIGAGLLIAGIVISVLWAGSFANSFLRQGMIINDVTLAPSGSGRSTIRVTDIAHPIALQVHFESQDSNSNSSQNAQRANSAVGRHVSLSEVVEDPAGKVLSNTTFSRQFFTTLKPTAQGTYTLIISNLGSDTVNVGALFGPATFLNENNQLNFNIFGGVVAGLSLAVLGILALIAGIIVLILDRRKGAKGNEPVTTR
jgi:hypothetical protein